MWAATYTSTMKLTVTSKTAFAPGMSGVSATTLVCSSAISDDCNTSLVFNKDVYGEVPDGMGLKDFGIWIGTFFLIEIPQTFTFYLKTEVDPSFENEYVFSHWTDPDGKVVEGLGASGACTYVWMAKNSDVFDNRITSLKAKNPTKTVAFTAHWVQPQVTAAAVTSNCGEVTDPNVAPTNGVVKFTLNRDVEASNYTAYTSGLTDNNFKVRSSKYQKGEYIYNIAYEPTGVHGTFLGEMTLCSNYPTASVDNKCKDATISVVENYEPSFAAIDTYNFGAVAQGSYRQTPKGYLSLEKSNYAARNAQWIAEIIPGANSDGLFVLEGDYSTSGEPEVRFAPSVSVAEGEYSATLKLKAVYYDAANVPIPSDEKEVVLTASVYEPVKSLIQFGSPEITVVDFGTVTLGTSPERLVLMVMDKVLDNAESPAFAWTDNTIFGYDYDAGNLVLHLLSDISCGDYTATMKASAISSIDASVVTDEIEVKAQIRLAKPVLEAYGGLGRNTLSWSVVEGASEYIVYRDGVALPSTTATKYIDSDIDPSSTHSYYVVAVYTADEYNTQSDAVTVTEGFPNVITKANASSTGIYTGTEGGPSETYIFHRGKQMIDVQRAFDQAGKALFDTLYIFGLTGNTDAAVATYVGTDGKTYTNVPQVNTPHLEYDEGGNLVHTYPCNATTPCYVYANNGDKYDHVPARSFDAVKTRYNWGTKQNGKKIYFTGYCPFAYMGVDYTEDGWMKFEGGNDVVDIYLDNCEIMGRFKTPSGINADYNHYRLILEASLANIFNNKVNTSFVKGISAVFVFSSTTKNSGESYKPHIHIAGRNHLKGQLGSYIHETYGSVEDMAEVNANIGNIYTFTAPIVVQPTDPGQYTDLVMDDIWLDGTLTNGYLHLDSEKADNPSEKTVAIDLGSANGSLTINGGQYHLRNAAADGTYACNLAVGYRKFKKEITYKDIPCVLELYGFGGDMTDSKVIINAGTFTMYANMYPDASGGWLGTGYYEDRVNFLDLRLPAGKGETQINGGTFNGISHVFVCSQVISTGTNPKNASGWWLCLQDVEVDPKNLTPSGSVKFEIPAPFNDEIIYPSANKVSYNLVEDEDVVASAFQYGGQSVNPFKKDSRSYVRLLLAGDASCGEECGCVQQPEKIYHQWATALPLFEASKKINDKTETITMGGPADVMEEDSGEEIYHPTVQLLYMDLQGMQESILSLPNEAGISFKDKSKPRGEFTNSASYTIYENINYIRTFQADEWYTFTAPFNIKEVYVIETPSDSVINTLKRPQAMDLQAQNNLEIIYGIQDFIIPTLEGRASSLDFREMIMFSEGIGIYPLSHYDSTNLMTANYYLYELDAASLNSDGEFLTDAAGRSLNIDWTPVNRTAGEPTMYKGKTYAIQFPYCPMCNDLSTRNYYDYWSNKFILFYGQGPQTIDGKNSQASIVAKTTSEGTATLVGNTTFADMTLPAQKGYVHNAANDMFELNNAAYTVKPGQGYLLFNPNPSQGMPSRISRAGEMIYDSQDETGLGGIPTIGDRSSLMLFDAENGVEVLSLRNQWVAVYNTQGNLLYQSYMTEGQQQFIALAAGIYVIKGDKEAIKFLVD